MKKMSLIFGINLCDRIYLSGDTRLSYRKNGNLIHKKDKVCKVVPFTNNIISAFAGDAGISAFIAKKLVTAITPSLTIRELREKSKEILTPLIDEYWSTTDNKASMVVIFGGLNPKQKKKIDAKEAYEKLMNYMKTKDHSGKIKNSFLGLLTRSNNPFLSPETSDSHVFSVRVSPPSNFVFEDAEWGEYLAYGPNGISKESLNVSTFGKIEFTSGRPGEDNMSITAILKEVAENTRAETIGEAFVNMVIADNLVGVVGGTIYRVNMKTMQVDSFPEILVRDGKLFSKNRGEVAVELTSIKDYTKFGNLEI